MKQLKLTPIAKEELALALILWKDFKWDNGVDPMTTLQMFEFADMLGVRLELEGLLTKLPPFKIEPRK